ncbi:AlpA family phage regulatory protein [Burkholderia sp. 500H]|nr:AlpA family phage regulatory protein [Burkholderia orbicola]
MRYMPISTMSDGRTISRLDLGTLRKLCLSGRAPQPIQLSQRCTVWKNSEIHAYLKSPLDYRSARL